MTIKWLLLALVTRAGLSSASGQQIRKAQQYFDQGIALSAQHNYHKASELFAKAIEVNPEFGEAYYQLGISSVSDGKPQDAIRAFMQLAQLEPNKVEPVLAAAQLYYALGFMDDALALSVRALLIEPDNPSIYFNIGLIYVQQKHPLQAIEALQHAVALQPTTVKARLLLASTYLSTGKETEAIKTLQDGITNDPTNPELMTSLGEVYLRAGRLLDAEKLFQSSLASKNSLQAHVDLARVFRLQHRFPEAIAGMTAILQDRPDASEALLERGIDFYESGNSLAARHDLEVFSEKNKIRPEGYYYLGRIDLDEHHPEAAIVNLKRSAELAPGNCEALTSLAKAYLSLGQFGPAESSLTGCTAQDGSTAQLLKEIRQKHAESEHN